MLKQTAARALRSCGRRLADPDFWLLLLGLAVAILVPGLMLMLAIDRYDAYLRLRPLVCEQGVSDRQFFVGAMAAPFGLLFMLVALGELWEQVERRRAGRPTRWLHFGLFFLLASILGALVLFALGC